MKKVYSTPTIETLMLNSNNIIITSLGIGDGDADPGDRVLSNRRGITDDYEDE